MNNDFRSIKDTKMKLDIKLPKNQGFTKYSDIKHEMSRNNINLLMI